MLNEEAMRYSGPLLILQIEAWIVWCKINLVAVLQVLGWITGKVLVLWERGWQVGMPLSEVHESCSSGYGEVNATVNKSCWAFSFKFHKCWRWSHLCLSTTFLKQETEVKLLLHGWSDGLHVVWCPWGGYFWRQCNPWDCCPPEDPQKLRDP